MQITPTGIPPVGVFYGWILVNWDRIMAVARVVLWAKIACAKIN